VRAGIEELSAFLKPNLTPPSQSDVKAIYDKANLPVDAALRA
jgi:hypothetical protein